MDDLGLPPDDELEALTGDEGDIDIPPDATEQSLAQLVQLQQQSQEQIASAMQQISEMQAQISQTIIQGLQTIAQGQKQLAAAISAPRKRVPIRDESGRITEAHDIPMRVQ